MKVDADTLAGLIGVPDYNDEIIQILEVWGEDRPSDSGTGTAFVTSQSNNISLMFDYNIFTNEQKKLQETGCMFLNQIDFREKSAYGFPFGLMKGDTPKSAIEKIHSNQDLVIDGQYIVADTYRIWISMGERKLFLNIKFEDEALKSLKDVLLNFYHVESDYSAFEPYKVDL